MVEYFVHGVHVRIASEWTRFLHYVALNLGAFSPARATFEELQISVSLSPKPWLSPREEDERPREGEAQWGENLLSNEHRVRYRTGAVAVEFVEGPPADVRATYLLDRRNRLASPFRDVPRWEEIQAVARYAVYLPLFHLLERAGGVVLHAGAVADRKGAVVLAGLNGSGKSTLCSSLLDRMEYLSDNYVIWNGTDVLAFPESLRLPLARAPASASHHPSVWGKRLVPPDASRVVLSAKPRSLVFLTLARQTALIPLSRSEAARRLDIIQDMTAEFPRYGYLGPLSPPRRPSATSSLAESVPSYGLAIGDVESARAKILELAGEAPA